MLINLAIDPTEEGMYQQILSHIKSRIQIDKAFDIEEKKTKNNILAKKTELEKIFGNDFLQQIIKDKCDIERLIITIEMLIEWLIEEIKSDKFFENYNVLINWLKDELKTRETL